jgi:ubiquinone/menaquinone biosynthesis C-methylase UbiE
MKSILAFAATAWLQMTSYDTDRYALNIGAPSDTALLQHQYPSMVVARLDVQTASEDYFNPSSFDVVMLRYSLLDVQRIHQKEKLAAQICRVLKPDGRLLVEDYKEDHIYFKELINTEHKLRAKIAPGWETYDAVDHLRLFRRYFVLEESIHKDGTLYSTFRKERMK